MDFDIVVIGAGPAGLSLAGSLADTDLRILMVERLAADELADPPVDGRDIALTHLSVAILRRIGAWRHIPESRVHPLSDSVRMLVDLLRIRARAWSDKDLTRSKKDESASGSVTPGRRP